MQLYNIYVGQPKYEIKKKMKDRDVVNTFVAYLCKHGYPGLQVDRRPDEENRLSTDIDAIAGNLAIEHTSIDTVPNQRRDSDWFIRAAGGLEKELPKIPPFRLNIIIEYDAIAKGQDWAAIRQSLKNWIIEDTPRIVDGHHIINDIPDVPFRLHIKKAGDRRPNVIFGRFTPKDDTLPSRIFQQIERKAGKLSKYHDQGLITVLLIESEDLALMDDSIMLDSIRAAYPTGLPDGVNKIWFADTSIPTEIEFIDFTSLIEK